MQNKVEKFIIIATVHSTIMLESAADFIRLVNVLHSFLAIFQTQQKHALINKLSIYNLQTSATQFLCFLSSCHSANLSTLTSPSSSAPRRRFACRRSNTIPARVLFNLVMTSLRPHFGLDYVVKNGPILGFKIYSFIQLLSDDLIGFKTSET